MPREEAVHPCLLDHLQILLIVHGLLRLQKCCPRPTPTVNTKEPKRRTGPNSQTIHLAWQNSNYKSLQGDRTQSTLRPTLLYNLAETCAAISGSIGQQAGPSQGASGVSLHSHHALIQIDGSWGLSTYLLKQGCGKCLFLCNIIERASQRLTPPKQKKAEIPLYHRSWDKPPETTGPDHKLWVN